MLARPVSYTLLLGAVLAVASCDSEDTVAGGCSGSLATETQQGKTINATGSFKGGQPLMRLTQGDNNQTIVSATYDDKNASFDVTGVAPGTYTVTWILSCDNADGEVVITSGVKSITIS